MSVDDPKQRKKIEVDSELVIDLIEKVTDLTAQVAVFQDRIESVPHDIHNEHHRIFEEERELKRIRREFWEDVRKKLVTRGIFGTISLVVWVVGALLYFWWNHNSGAGGG